ncbi:hypothetical protein ACFVIM_17640 [Streptomyces sp. NPDC057638]|uniref:hypothetical protein n=1 Tax=Streptomyces sp. NPDC057638 TaxID=3346190 RepID=UPI0036BE135C
MNRQTITRGIGALVAAFALTLGSSGQASAASQHLWTYTSPGLCVSGYAETSTGADGGGFSKSIAYTWHQGNTAICATAFTRPVGWISVESYLIAYDAPRGVWYRCGAPVGPYTNSVPAFGWQVYRHTYRACGGNVWYATNTASYSYGGVRWHGGWVVSGSHWVPLAGRADTAPPTAPRISAAEALRRGEIRVGGPDGPRATAAQLQPEPTRAPGTTTPIVPRAGVTVSPVSR